MSTSRENEPDLVEKEEELLGKALDWKILKRLFRYIIPYRRIFIASVAVLVALSGVALIGPYLIKRAVDGPLTSYILEGQAPSETMGALLIIVGFYLVFILVESVLRYLQILITNRCGQSVIKDLRDRVFAHIHKMSLAFFDRNPVGMLVTRVTSDVESLSEVFVSGAAILFEDIFKLTLIVGVLFWINTKLAVVTLVVLVPLFLIANSFRKKSRTAFRDVRHKVANTNAYLNEAISGLRVTQIFGQEHKSLQRFDRRNAALRDCHLGTVRIYSAFFPAVEIVSQLGIVVLLLFGSREIVAGHLTYGQFIQFWFYTKFFFEPIRDLAEKYNVLQAAMASSERIFRILDTAIEIEDPATPVQKDDIRGKIVFDRVSFSYKPDTRVLNQLSFTVNAGETLAVVGATGAGKSTIINLIPRFYDPQGGRILIDDIDVREYPKQWLRSRIGVVLQDVFLFSGTVADNIRLGESDSIPMERVRKVAAHVNAARFIDRLPSGYDTEVNERGSTLSVGERQLLSFARALAFDPKILILDEATSSIDTETEQLIQNALRKLLKDRTSIIIAHRLSTIQQADRILVIHKGELREDGNHEELLKKGGIYKRLYQLQYEAQERLRAAARGNNGDVRDLNIDGNHVDTSRS